MKKCIIFASMPVEKKVFDKYCTNNEKYFLITADAGWERAAALGLAPDLAVGDFDSAAEPEKAKEILRLPAHKDETDLVFAVKQALERGFLDITIFGALGGRADQNLASLQTLLYVTKRGAAGRLVDEGTEVLCTGPGRLFAPAAPGRYLSVFAAAGETFGVTLKGVEYPLHGAHLTVDMPLGVSNEFLGDGAEVSCTEGYLFVMTVQKEG